MVNVPLLRKAVEWAEAEAALGDEGTWRQARYMLPSVTSTMSPTEFFYLNRDRQIYKVPDCKTSYCIAGYVAVEVCGQDIDWLFGYRIRECAREALGITDQDADLLFMASNSIETVRAVAEDIAGEKL